MGVRASYRRQKENMTLILDHLKNHPAGPVGPAEEMALIELLALTSTVVITILALAAVTCVMVWLYLLAAIVGTFV